MKSSTRKRPSFFIMLIKKLQLALKYRNLQITFLMIKILTSLQYILDQREVLASA